MKLPSVRHNHVLADYILAVVNAVVVADFLNMKRHKSRHGLCGKGSQRINLSLARRKHRVQSVQLLKTQHSHLAMPCLDNRFKGFCIRIQLFLTICSVYYGCESKHHLLVSYGQVIEEFLAVVELPLHVVRHNRPKIVIGILLSLPCGYVGGDSKESVFRFSYGLRHGHRQNIYGKHHVLIQACQLCNQRILKIGCHIF